MGFLIATSPVITPWDLVDQVADHDQPFHAVCEDCGRGWEFNNELAATQQALLHLLMGPVLYPDDQHIAVWIFPASEDLS